METEMSSMRIVGSWLANTKSKFPSVTTGFRESQIKGIKTAQTKTP